MRISFLMTLVLCLFLHFSDSSLGRQQKDNPNAQPQPGGQAELPNVPDELASELKSLRARIADAQLDEAQLKTANASLAIVESNIKRTANSRQQTDLNQELINSAEQRANSQREALKQLGDEPVEDIPKASDLASLGREIRQQLALAQSELKAIQAAIASRRESAKTASQSVEELQKQKDELKTKLTEPAPLNENAIVSEAREFELRSTLRCIAAEIDRLLFESRLFDAEDRAGFLVAKNEFWTAKEKRLQDLADRIQSKLEQQRRSETQKSVDQAKEDIEQVAEVLKSFAEENARIAELATSMLEPLKKAQADLKAKKLELDQLTKQFVATENRVNVVGLTASVGAYLRNRKTEIPLEGWLQPILVDRLSEIEKYQSQQFDLQEAEQSLITDEEIERALTDAGDWQLTKKEQLQIAEKATELVGRRRELLAQAITNHKDCLITLTNLQKTEGELGRLTTKFHEYINERILWIRSNDFIFSKFEHDESNAELLSRQNWIVTGQKFAQDARQHLMIYLVTGFAFSALFYYRMRMRKAIISRSEIVSKKSNTAFLPTLTTVLLTVGVALPLPMLLCVFGWRMTSIVNGTMLTIALGQSLVSAGWFFFLGEVLRQICRKNGLAASHFGWTKSTLTILNRELAWFVPLGTSFSFLCTLLFLINSHDLNDTIERICFIVGISILAIFLYRILHPHKGMFREQIAQYPKAWLVQSRNIAFWLIIAFPVTLIVMIVIGYYYSAIQMLSRLFSTIIVVVGLEILRSLVLKFIQLSRRKARIAQSRARLSAAHSSGEDTDANSVAAELERAADVETFLASETEAMDENFERSRKLIAAGIAVSWVFAVAMIWADVFPALKGLDRYVFWTTTVDQIIADNLTTDSLLLTPTGTPLLKSTDTSNQSVDGQPSNGSTQDVRRQAENESGRITQVRQPVTLRHFLIAVFVLTVSVFAFKNLPAFIELVFLKHLPIEHSIRHAIRAITGYIILMVGVIVAGRSMYIGWNHIQWLATALTFGLAFGLQEIFANFIAGIILLLERPIRIGDIVQVDDVSGVVSKIKIRATTIRNFDQKELVIPNKEFITGRLLNWTLADKVIRQTHRVGIAYGSNVRKAKEIIRRICESHPHILDEPKTVITFEEFGDSSLNISIRVYLKDFDVWWPTMDDINLAIDDGFKEAGIEIAFPQRDLHLRTAGTQFENALMRTMSQTDGNVEGTESIGTRSVGQDHINAVTPELETN